jgi:NTP pyrophosphatase (non-canonical NTP hydrolase)
MTELVELIKKYYDKRGLKWPTFSDALKFVHTELAEVYELDLARVGGFVRNNPETKPKFNKEDLAEELGDAIMMLLVAGIVEDVDPIAALIAKMKRKLQYIYAKSEKVESYVLKEDPHSLEFWE